MSKSHFRTGSRMVRAEVSEESFQWLRAAPNPRQMSGILLETAVMMLQLGYLQIEGDCIRCDTERGTFRMQLTADGNPQPAD